MDEPGEQPVDEKRRKRFVDTTHDHIKIVPDPGKETPAPEPTPKDKEEE